MPDRTYCYPDSNTLRNKLNITEDRKLLVAEIEITGTRLAQLQKNPVKGNFDFKHLCSIHRTIFRDIFDWAGKPRTVDISKGNLFCPVWNIASYADEIFSKYYPDCIAAKDDPEKFVHQLTGHYADLNALHPFREGNGRSQREFARELCLECGYTFDLMVTSHTEMLHASIKSFSGDNRMLEDIFKKAVNPFADYRNHL